MTDVKQKVLIIEDNAVNAQLLTLFLEEAGFEVVRAHDGQTGLETIASHKGINVVLLDRIMPDMDGLQALKAIKLGQKSWNIPVIMLTAALSSKQIEEAKLVGAFACLPKPYDKTKIVNTINDALKQGRRN